MRTILPLATRIIARSQTIHRRLATSFRPNRGFLIFGLLMVLMLSACGGAAEQAASPSEGATPTTSAASEEALPGTEEFGLTMEQLVSNIEAVEGLIADCMSAAGFEYVAADFETTRAGMLADKSLPGLSEDEFISQYGFGISTLYTSLAPQLADAITPAALGLGRQNIEIFNGLSPADQTAYNRALFGEHSDATFAVALEAEDFSRTGGCTREAITQVFTSDQLNVTYTNPLDSLVQQDPRMITALGEYTDCIREAGFDYSHPDQVEADIHTRLDAITEGLAPEALSPDALAALTELQGEERAIASAAFDCEDEFLTPVEEQILRELYAAPVQ